MGRVERTREEDTLACRRAAPKGLQRAPSRAPGPSDRAAGQGTAAPLHTRGAGAWEGGARGLHGHPVTRLGLEGSTLLHRTVWKYQQRMRV